MLLASSVHLFNFFTLIARIFAAISQSSYQCSQSSHIICKEGLIVAITYNPPQDGDDDSGGGCGGSGGGSGGGGGDDVEGVDAWLVTHLYQR